eukprot:382365-Pleurochrysis_carterae.AAC.1
MPKPMYRHLSTLNLRPCVSTRVFAFRQQYKRSLLVSYLDEELLVVRDALGRPDVLMCADETPYPAPATPHPKPSHTPSHTPKPHRIARTPVGVEVATKIITAPYPKPPLSLPRSTA